MNREKLLGLKDQICGLGTKGATLQEQVEDLQANTKTLRDKIQDMEDEADSTKTHTNFQEETEFPLVYIEIINCVYILLGRSH